MRDTIGSVEGSFRPRSDKKASCSRRGMVSTAFPDATAAGAAMLKAGGNAADAACAASMALAVCEPQASGIGGQTIALVRAAGRVVSLDGSSRAPSLAHHTLQAGRQGWLVGYCASTVPSTVATIGYLHEHYGRLEWERIMAPAVRLAKRGYRVTALQHRSQKDNLQLFGRVRSRSGAKYFLKDGAVPYDAGDRFVQEDLAETLLRISRYGYQSFYHGEIADAIDRDMRRHGGLLRKEDLALVPEPVERRPISATYMGARITTVPPPGAGNTALLVLMMLDGLPHGRLQRSDPLSYHYLAEVFRKALLYRTQRPFDPRTYPQLRNRTHMSRRFAGRLARTIKDSMDASLPRREPPAGSDDTTHLSVMDDEGGVVSLTQSIELVYGSKAAADGLGFLYNNYMSAFELENPAHPFFLRPNAAPWSSVCPCIIFHDGEPWIAAGSPGSERIFSTMALFISGMLSGGRSMYDSMSDPRLHCTVGGRISMEGDSGSERISKYLSEQGYQVNVRERHSFHHGAIHAAMKCQTRDGFQGVAEIRRDGTAAGPA